ncbi:hypothetical protein C1H57_09100 [Clostridium sp. 2-1]|uniref:nuclease-related domain-containing DEAD/DEAH box helicase n=1 Tax=Clostridium TaxID=1485 RepID=UPI000CDA1EB4|nr:MULTISPECIES: NERD domain-containing protein [Clostridium]MBN7575327.1 NERD domain-containing protein [Clostridium beijerinckii]MBN7580637.1 NERD domain-containing protein [Clostridium beijerinckii]MBN7585091.1 NERD domain-containing protein [Clostridium beijerinckii]MBO0520981.1 NERD domain-containing protein [Clostridium beijerinckii]POO91661.1 hypothetical protein C1H57_09100 [Clostridium sp. 2-1]
MAIMIPFELNEGDYLSQSEKEVFDILKNELNDDWIVIYSLRWVTEDKLCINKSNGECDFIILNHNYGILALEVKGGIINFENGEWTSIDKNNIKNTIKDPEKQANTTKYQLISRLKREKLNAYITTAVWFPDIELKKLRLPMSMPKEVVLDMNSFKNIEESLINIFKYRADKEHFDINPIMLSDYNKIRKVLVPDIKGSIPLSRKCEKLNSRYITLNNEQSLCFEQLEDNRFISIKGHAGTGKTVLAIKKALKDSKAKKKALYVCYNNMLFNKVREEAQGEFEVYGIHIFAEEYLKEYHPKYYDEFQENGDYDEMMSHYLEVCSENKEKKHILFDTILVDEGQDFKEEWFKSLYNFLDDNASLYVFYDELQMLYEKFGQTDISFLDIGVRYNLKRNMRNTDEICLSSLKVIDVDENSIILNGINGLKPEIMVGESQADVMEKLKSTLKDLRLQKIKDENITILMTNARKKVSYSKAVREYSNVMVESVRKYKGLENDIIIIPDIKEDFLNNDEIKKLLYVAMSRARVHVIMIIDSETLNRKQRAAFKKEMEYRLI